MAETKTNFFSEENVYKLTIGVIAWLGLFYGLKSDVRDNETANAKDHLFINYRLTNIEQKLEIKQSFVPNDKQENNGPVVMNYYAAILPHKLETEDIKCIYE